MAGAKFSPHVLRQIFILSICRFAEPIALTSIFPYLYYMIKSFGVPEADISYYAGITASSFSFAQFLTGVFWGRLSDITGRKPLVLIGLAGTMVAMILFGFSTSVRMAIVARCMAGLVNGNVGILRTVVAELVPERELQPRAFSVMPLVWNVASVLGPMIGGALADPLHNYPEFFNGWQPDFVTNFLAKFPFALPSLVCALFFMIGLPIGFLYLEESLESKRGKRDIGIEWGKKITNLFTGGKHHHQHHKTIEDDEASPLLSDDLLIATADEEIANIVKEPEVPQGAPPLSDAFTFQSSINIVYYVMLALHSVAYDQLMPVFMSYPPQDRSEQKLPFKFAGGFGLPSSEIGVMFSVFGATCMLLQFFLFPIIANRLGSLRCLQIVACIFPVVYFTTPLIIILPIHLQRSALALNMAFKGLATVFAFPCSTILLTNSSPSLRILGTLNGIAVALAALGRSFGPSFGGVLFSHGQKSGYIILPWWILAGLTSASIIPTMMMVDKGGIGYQDQQQQEVDDAGEVEALLNEGSSCSREGYGTISNDARTTTA